MKQFPFQDFIEFLKSERAPHTWYFRAEIDEELNQLHIVDGLNHARIDSHGNLIAYTNSHTRDLYEKLLEKYKQRTSGSIRDEGQRQSQAVPQASQRVRR